MTRRRVLSCAVRLLDLGFFRVGSEQYAEENGTFGLATIRREHVTVSRDGVITFDYTAKSSKHRAAAGGGRRRLRGRHGDEAPARAAARSCSPGGRAARRTAAGST